MGLLSLNRVSLRYGDRVLLDAADLSVEAGDRMSLIGRNGCGKTTLLKMLSGLAAPTEGDFTLYGKSGKKENRWSMG